MKQQHNEPRTSLSAGPITSATHRNPITSNMANKLDEIWQHLAMGQHEWQERQVGLQMQARNTVIVPASEQPTPFLIRHSTARTKFMFFNTTASRFVHISKYAKDIDKAIKALVHVENTSAKIHNILISHKRSSNVQAVNTKIAGSTDDMPDHCMGV